jgi:hypothetical protein
MPTPRSSAPRRLGEAMRRKLEVTSALAWEALVDTHVEQASQFVDRLAEYWPIDDALPRYLREMDIDPTMATAIRTRVLAERQPHGTDADTDGAATGAGTGTGTASAAPPRAHSPRPVHRTAAAEVAAGAAAASAAAEAAAAAPAAPAADDDGSSSWDFLRQPRRVVRSVIERQRRNDRIERIVQLALARAEENVIRTHVENAIGFVALLEEQLPLDRCVQQYLTAVGLAGGRAQAVFQRTMARLADVHL